MSNEIKLVAKSSAGRPASLYINGVEVGGVIDIDLNALTAKDDISHITVKLAVNSFEYEHDLSAIDWMKGIL